MTPGSYRFERFVLDPADRRLTCDTAPIEINARYLDALVLLVREHGRLVSKDRFHEEVWRGVPVTDEALTQCIRTLRRLLGDAAGSPRFIETVPRYGYRFIAPVETTGAPPSPQPPSAAEPSSALLTIGMAGTVGGGIAGLVGGLFYGFAGASLPSQPGMGTISTLLVLVCVTTLLALAGAAGVSFGIATASRLSRPPGPWSIAGGALGGLLVGAVVKMIGLDAFNLLLGQSPGDITGAAEGALLGGAVGLGAWLGGASSLRRGIAIAAAAGGAAGIAITLIGGRLMGGSLDLLARHVAGSRLRLDPIAALVGEDAFGPLSLALTSALEGMLFAGCIVGAMILAERRGDRR